MYFFIEIRQNLFSLIRQNVLESQGDPVRGGKTIGLENMNGDYTLSNDNKAAKLMLLLFM